MLKKLVTKGRTAVCALVALLVGVSSARADVTVTGSGKITVLPDIAYITLAVVTDGATAAEALDANSAAMRRLFKLLEALGIAERDVQTSQFGVAPKYRRVKDGEPVLIGYTVTNQITVKVRKLDEAGKVIDALVKEGANRVSGITFAVEDPEKAMDEARAKAMADAARKAGIFAKGGNVTLGSVKSINESHNAPALRWHYELQAAPFKDGVPFKPGEQDLTVHVTVVYSITGGQK